MWIIPAIILVLGGYGLNAFHRVAVASNRVQRAWKDVDLHLKRRHDVAASLVITLQQYAEHETAAIEGINCTRDHCLESTTPAEKGRAEALFSAQIRNLLAVTENYPELKADREHVRLHTILAEVENDLESARHYYNYAVRAFNSMIKEFPHYLIADRLGYNPEEVFELGFATR